MTAAELHALKKDWPEEASAKGLVYGWHGVHHGWGRTDCLSLFDINHAIALHVASGQEHLETIFESVKSRKGVDYEVVCRVFKSDEEVVGTGPTKLRAISAAMTATRGGG